MLEVDKLARVPRAQNSDTLAGQGPGAYSERWALVNAQGQIEQQTGGFSVVSCFQAPNPNCYVNANEDVTNNGVDATIAATNTGGGGQLAGKIGAAPCGLPFVACAPPGTENANVVVVTPRDSEGNASPSRFYVHVTGSSTTP